METLGDEYFRLHYAFDPFGAGVFGVPGHEGEVPDPSRAAAERHRAELDSIAERLALNPLDDPISHAVLRRLLDDGRRVLADGIAEVGLTAGGTGPLAMVVSTVPASTGTDAEYLERLNKLPAYFAAYVERYDMAAADGRMQSRIGVRQAIAQADAYLAAPLGRDPLNARAGVESVVADRVRPAVQSFRDALEERFLPVARDDEHVGLCHVPGGTDGYLGLVRAHTTTDLTPEAMHEIGLGLIARLRDEFAERGAKALGTSDVDEVLVRLREDRNLRFGTAAEIVDTVTRALREAETALPDWFHPYDIAPCVVREMDPAEAEHSVLGYYMPPSADGRRPGAHVINTLRPERRARFEYEALAFHESVPGHHLQIAVAQSRPDLPDFRRFAYFDAHGEGWGLYSERLADEMGLYSGEITRLGMVSFDAWRACRLVVDTGLHHFGWSRGRAIDYMLANTALSATNVKNEVDRYIAVPGQALAYMIGRLRLDELRGRTRLDVRAFHHEVLAHGPLPLDVLEDLIASRDNAA